MLDNVISIETKAIIKTFINILLFDSIVEVCILYIHILHKIFNKLLFGGEIFCLQYPHVELGIKSFDKYLLWHSECL